MVWTYTAQSALHKSHIHWYADNLGLSSLPINMWQKKAGIKPITFFGNYMHPNEPAEHINKVQKTTTNLMVNDKRKWHDPRS